MTAGGQGQDSEQHDEQVDISHVRLAVQQMGDLSCTDHGDQVEEQLQPGRMALVASLGPTAGPVPPAPGTATPRPSGDGTWPTVAGGETGDSEELESENARPASTGNRTRKSLIELETQDRR
ncbi:hypothetical protein AB0I93_38575, partial [Streptomyces sp. NPDC049967]|uniref:hypothetical protein n=1 Tax=Streptomyces sp. NPDC049967 TaxID=3155658 RepID=UPI0034488A4C